MAPKLSHHLISKLFFLFVVVQALPVINSHETQFSQSLRSLRGARKGYTVKGLNQVKQYLKSFGYYPNHINNLTDHYPNHINNLTDHYDDILESSLKTYQKYHRLQVTGQLDAATRKQMLIPRCGGADIFINNSNADNMEGRSYSFFDGMPRWSKRHLTYAFRSSVWVISDENLRPVIARAFEKWAAITDFTFQEASAGEAADIVIGFHQRDHGDGVPFDGPGVILAHSFQPEVGWLHFDAEESWSIGDSTGYYHQADLESLAVHEIGHSLGLQHSANQEAIMYPIIPYGTIKRDLGIDDIEGIRVLYGY